jgi:prephenate dehydrogenase
LERWGTVAIVGVGLIGGSIGLTLRSRGLAAEVVGIGRSRRSLDRAEACGAVDRTTTDLALGVAHADVVVVCTPVDAIVEDVRRAADITPSDVLITDAGSTKRRIVEALAGHSRASAVYVGAHPLAGSEQKGVDHARADLFEGRVCLLTPSGRTPEASRQRARAFWKSLGSRAIEMSPAEHDEILAYTSHLPHAVAAALASSIPVDWLPLAAGAYRDCTRVAGADPRLWTAIFRENRGPLLKALGAFLDRAAAFKYALMTDDEEAISSWWEEAKHRRDRFESLSQTPTSAGAPQKPPEPA